MRDLFDTLASETEIKPVVPKTPRPHQIEAIRQIYRTLAQDRRVVCQGPTGFGKTLTAAKIIQHALDRDQRVIFTAPAISLIDQTVTAFEAEGIDPRQIGVMQASHPRTDPLARVQVASVQTLARRDIPVAGVVIVDECHIRSAVVDALMDERPDVFFIGLSATPWAKGMGLRWRNLVVPITIKELIEAGYLSKFRALAPDDPDLRRVRTKAGEFHEGDLAEAMDAKEITASVVETWLAEGEDRPTLLFGVNRAHAKSLSLAFEAAGVATGYVDCNTDRVERDIIAGQFDRGEIKVACSVRTLTTGIDWEVSCIIDAAPTKSKILHVQKIGRGLRVNPGTEDLLILDHAGNSYRNGLVTDIHIAKLDMTPPGERQTDERATALPRPCVNCKTLFTGSLCPSCGQVRQAGNGGVSTKDGRLVEVDGSPSKDGGESTHESRERERAQKQDFWSMALHLCGQRKRDRNFALGLFKAKFGVWPTGLIDSKKTPDRNFMNYEKSRRIAWAKKKEAEKRARSQTTSQQSHQTLR